MSRGRNYYLRTKQHHHHHHEGGGGGKLIKRALGYLLERIAGIVENSSSRVQFEFAIQCKCNWMGWVTVTNNCDSFSTSFPTVIIGEMWSERKDFWRLHSTPLSHSAAAVKCANFKNATHRIASEECPGKLTTTLQRIIFCRGARQVLRVQHLAFTCTFIAPPPWCCCHVN